MSKIPTPHIAAKAGDFAETVLMPGDPLRAKFIAETFLTNPVLVNNVRGVQGYTGDYRGKRVSVMASGMGIPSIGIYSYELFNFYDVKNIIRVGTAGVIRPDLKVRDIVIGQGACTNSNFAEQFDMGVEPVVGNLYSSDMFYDDSQGLSKWQKMGVLAVEMEAAALYMNAARAGKNALAICTISDNPFTGEATTAEERQQNFTKMMEIALTIA